MAKEWYQYCKDCAAEYGYSDFSFQTDQKKGFSRPERCPKHLQQHAEEIRKLANSHFDLKPRKRPPSILGTPYLGEVSHGNRELRLKEIKADSSFMDIGITDDDIREVYEALESNQVLVIVGPTGSGKSTYVPYRLINPLKPREADFFTKNGPIIVTQPRIQATRGVPDAVGKLLLGASVGPGFEIGFRHGSATGKARGEQTDSRNRLVFVTDGTLLNWISGGRIGEFSVIMIDEAHERSCNIDLILGLIKRELPRYPHLKLIVASATIDAGKFVRYYSEVTPTKLVTFEGKKNFGYSRHWWKGESVSYEQAPKAMAEKVLEVLGRTESGGILGFLPGQKEINEAVGLIRKGLAGRRDVKVFPLYTALGVRMGDEALRPLEKVKVGNKWIEPRRVVIATNVAETSITIPDVGYVVDSGFIKMTEWNSATCRQELIPKRHSQDGCKQRWGRAGRVQKGDVYTLYNEDDFKTFPKHTPPEIIRSCLDDALLTAKASGITNLSAFSWIDEPPAVERKRSTNVIKKRGLVDAEEDLTEEGFEIFRLSRSISRLLDKADYNSTQRALDVATLLILADRYGCLLEAVTILAMMPRMGASLYWREDGLLIWDTQWDISSKDQIGRIHQSLRVGCLDDLDFAYKLFSLYEKQLPDNPDTRIHPWCRRNFVNAKNLALVSNAREGILKAFIRGKKDPWIRPLKYGLIERLRMLVAVGWPDRVVELEDRDPIRFKQPGANGPGLVSPLCCGSWKGGEKAVVGMLDRDFAFIDGTYQQVSMVNFLIQKSDNISSKEESEIAFAMAEIRDKYQEQQALAKLFADQLFPVGSQVRLHRHAGGESIEKAVSRPQTVRPKRMASFDGYGHPDQSQRFYERFSIDADEDRWEPDMDEDVLEEYEEVKLPFLLPERTTFEDIRTIQDQYGVEKRGHWDHETGEVIVLNWEMEKASPKAVVGPVVPIEVCRLAAEEANIEDRIEVTIVRAVFEQHSGRLAGFIAEGRKGIEIPLSVADLSVSLKNPGLKRLVGKKITVLVTGQVPEESILQVSRLQDLEADLETICNLEEVSGEVVEIDQNAITIAIQRESGTVHSATFPLETASKVIPDLAIGMELFFKVDLKEIKDNPPFFVLDSEISVLQKDELEKHGIQFIHGKMQCSERLFCKAVFSIAKDYPELYPMVRFLYARSRDLFISDIETFGMRKRFEELFEEASRVRDRAGSEDLETTKMSLISIQERTKETNFSQRSWQRLKLIIDDAWAIRKGAQIEKHRLYIGRLEDQIKDLENRIATSNNPGYINDARGWIREKQHKISGVRNRISVLEAQRADIARKIQEIRAKTKL